MGNFKKIVRVGFLMTIWTLLTFSIDRVKGQDIQFSQFYAAPLYLNPAFAGSSHSIRGTFHQRLQWPQLEGKYTTSLFSVDGFSSKYNSGAGFLLVQDNQGSGIISSTSMAFQYAYELPLNNKITARAGLELNLVSRSLDYSRLRFPSQFNDNDGYVGGGEQLGNPRVTFPDVSSGLVVYSPKMWFSMAYNHMNTPNQSFIGEVSRLPLKVSFTAGYKIHLGNKEHMAYLAEEKEVSITPTAHYKLQGKSDQVDIGLYGIYDRFILATWYRGIPIKNYKPDLPNNESMVFIGGYMIGSFSFTYSYDLTLSKLNPARTGGAHEINLTYIYHKKPKTNKPMRRLPCPHFYRDHSHLKPHQDVKPQHH